MGILQLFDQIGASVHSIEEAIEAATFGATYLIAGHIFSTHSKKGVPPRGLNFLKQVCDAVPIPVFAIGGITRNDVNDVKATGAKGVCIMSEAMTCETPDRTCTCVSILAKRPWCYFRPWPFSVFLKD